MMRFRGSKVLLSFGRLNARPRMTLAVSVARRRRNETPIQRVRLYIAYTSKKRMNIMRVGRKGRED